MNSYKLSLLKLRNFDSEFVFSATSSGGPGGQHANRRSTKIELRFHIGDSEKLNDTEKKIITGKLHHRITKDGFLILSVQSSRSALRNKLKAKRKFFELIAEALTPQKKRKAPKKPKSYHRKRLDKKKKKSEKKQRRKNDKLQ
ncbi:MAG: alternative ribosome rescue aminoacyl-tRNA hydrolase ArfB [Bacteroidota bacterium]|nr:alternative ribosome rescue aminoacyl-tRNA hydrolase ArfB [Bacteroidota bacterium]